MDTDRYIDRIQELRERGESQSVAHDRARRELLLDDWPKEWGDELRNVLVFGDFKAPDEDLVFEELGITIAAEKRENTVVNHRGAMVLGATISVSDRSLDGLTDAAQRLDLLLGVWFAAELENGHVGWWSWLTHSFRGGGSLVKFPGSLESTMLSTVLAYPERTQRRLRAALNWMRESRRGMKETRGSDVITSYMGGFIAFEILVEAVCELFPPRRLTRAEKQRLVDEYMGSVGQMTPGAVDELDRRLNIRFRGKATHALEVCFEDNAAWAVERVLTAKPDEDRLYQVRNNIAHGTIDVSDLDELPRIDGHLRALEAINQVILRRFFDFNLPSEWLTGGRYRAPGAAAKES